MKLNCIMCGRPVEMEEFRADPYDDEDDVPVKKPIVFCQICEAKIRNESDQSQKAPKPI